MQEEGCVMVIVRGRSKRRERGSNRQRRCQARRNWGVWFLPAILPTRTGFPFYHSLPRSPVAGSTATGEGGRSRRVDGLCQQDDHSRRGRVTAVWRFTIGLRKGKKRRKNTVGRKEEADRIQFPGQSKSNSVRSGIFHFPFFPVLYSVIRIWWSFVFDLSPRPKSVEGKGHSVPHELLFPLITFTLFTPSFDAALKKKKTLFRWWGIGNWRKIPMV